MTDEQVRIAIDVLRAYAQGILATDLCDELDEAILKAYQSWEASLPNDDDDYSDLENWQ